MRKRFFSSIVHKCSIYIIWNIKKTETKIERNLKSENLKNVEEIWKSQKSRLFFKSQSLKNIQSFLKKSQILKIWRKKKLEIFENICKSIFFLQNRFFFCREFFFVKFSIWNYFEHFFYDLIFLLPLSYYSWSHDEVISWIMYATCL